MAMVVVVMLVVVVVAEEVRIQRSIMHRVVLPIQPRVKVAKGGINQTTTIQVEGITTTTIHPNIPLPVVLVQTTFQIHKIIIPTPNLNSCPLAVKADIPTVAKSIIPITTIPPTIPPTTHHPPIPNIQKIPIPQLHPYVNHLIQHSSRGV